MKAIVYLSIYLVSIQSIFARQITAIHSGKWHDGKNWDLEVLPSFHDTIIIPAGIIMYADENIHSETNHFLLFGSIQIGKNKTLFIKGISQLKIQENGALIGDEHAKIIENEKINTVCSRKNQKITISPEKNNTSIDQKLIIRKNDTLLVDYSFLMLETYSFISIQHSYDGKKWETIHEVKISADLDSLQRVLALVNKKRVNNGDYIKISAFRHNGTQQLLTNSYIEHRYKKQEMENGLTFIPKTFILIGAASLTKMILFFAHK